MGASKRLKYWPPALPEWTTKGVRDIFFSSPSCPCLLNRDSLKRTIADGVNQGLFADGIKIADGQYEPLHFRHATGLSDQDIDISEDAVLLTAESAKPRIELHRLARLEIKLASIRIQPKDSNTFSASGSITTVALTPVRAPRRLAQQGPAKIGHSEWSA